MAVRKTAVLLALASIFAWQVPLARGQAPAPPPPAPHTIWSFLGIPQAVKHVHGSVANRHGKHPKCEKKPPVLGLADPANLKSDNPAIKKAAEIKKEEDLKKQKIKAIRYLTSVGCGCHNRDGSITDALLKSMDDCTEDVRLATIEAIVDAAGGEMCENCKQRSCCSEELSNKLYEIAYERNEEGCFLEPSERVRLAAAEALRICCPGTDDEPTLAPYGDEGPRTFEQPGAGPRPEAPNPATPPEPRAGDEAATLLSPPPVVVHAAPQVEVETQQPQPRIVIQRAAPPVVVERPATTVAPQRTAAPQIAAGAAPHRIAAKSKAAERVQITSRSSRRSAVSRGIAVPVSATTTKPAGQTLTETLLAPPPAAAPANAPAAEQDPVAKAPASKTPAAKAPAYRPEILVRLPVAEEPAESAPAATQGNLAPVVAVTEMTTRPSVIDLISEPRGKRHSSRRTRPVTARQERAVVPASSTEDVAGDRPSLPSILSQRQGRADNEAAQEFSFPSPPLPLPGITGRKLTPRSRELPGAEFGTAVIRSIHPSQTQVMVQLDSSQVVPPGSVLRAYHTYALGSRKAVCDLEVISSEPGIAIAQPRGKSKLDRLAVGDEAIVLQ